MKDGKGDVAIIGMACMFPKAKDLRAYWDNILGRVDAISDPPDDWGSDLVYDPTSSQNDRLYTQRGGYIGDIAEFNPMRYGVMPRSVEGGEPEHFLALHVAHEALADAGYLDRPFNRERAAVILGRGTYTNRGIITVLQHTIAVDQTIRMLSALHPEYTPEELSDIKQRLKASLPPFNAETAPSLVPSIMCGRIANRLNLMGPAYAVDAACASSLIAVDLGMNDLINGKCDLVLAGGVQISSTFPVSMIFTQLGGMSPSGRLRPFHPKADGSLLGEGVGVVILKRREDAERDDDRIYAVIKAVGTASDGRALGVLAPRMEGEVLAMQRAYERAGISPSKIGLVEAHGTGTPVGDATELASLTHVFGAATGDVPTVALGSVKSMIGHTIPASGVAGLIKTALALYHKVLPPTLHAEEGNPKLESTPFYLNTETRPWIHNGLEPRRAAASAFGFGGINAHVILEEHPNTAVATTTHGNYDSEIFILAADSRAELLTKGEQLRVFLAARPNVPPGDLAYTLNCPLPEDEDKSVRLVIVATSLSELDQKLAQALRKLADPACRQIKDRAGIYFFDVPLGRQGKLAFLFPGEGSQYVNMLADLCVHFPVVRAWFDRIDRAFVNHERNYLPSQVIFPPPHLGAAEANQQRLWQMDCGAEAVFTANQALFALLSQLQIRPHAFVGHSTGEGSALLASGAIPVENEDQLIEPILALNKIYEQLQAKGQIPEATLVAVSAGKRETVDLLVEESQGLLSIAMDNCPHQVILCGTKAISEQAIQRLTSEGAVCTTLPFNRAYHTPHFAHFSAQLRDFYQGLNVVQPKAELYSCTIAGQYPADPDEIRRLAAEQWSRPVRFRETIEAMYADGVRLFVEVGPRGNLTAFVDDILRGRPYLGQPTNVMHRSGMTQLNHLIGLLAAHAAPMNLDYLYARRVPRRLSLDPTQAQDAGSQGHAMKLSLALPMLTLQRTDRPADVKPRAMPLPASVPASSPVPDKEPTGPSSNVADRGASMPTPAPAPPIVSPPPAALSLNVASGSVVEPRESVPSVRPLSEAPPVVESSTFPPRGAKTQVMEEYLHTMARFLDTQQTIMQAVLQRKGSVPTVDRLADAVMPSIVGQAAWDHEERGPSAQAPTPEPQPPTVERAVPVARVDDGQEAAAGSHAIAMPAISAMPRETITKTLLHIMSERTGYPIEMLDPALNLEADMGIDSIKRVEILGQLQRETGLLGAEDMERISGLKTLQQIIDVLARTEAPPSMPALPFIGSITSITPGQELVALRRIGMDTDPFLRDHTLGKQVSSTDQSLMGLAVVPFTMSMEMLAEAAATLMPGKHVVGMRDIRASRWIALTKNHVTLQLTAKRKAATLGDEVEVQLREVADPDSSEVPPIAPVMEGTVIMADRYPAAPMPADFHLPSERPSTWRPEQLYTEGMFHGPAFQGVVSMDRWGADGTEATLEVLPAEGLFAAGTNGTLLIDPVLLDQPGQVVAFWMAEHLEKGHVIFPFHLEALELYGPTLPAHERVKCRVRVTDLSDMQMRSDLEIVRADGHVWGRLVGWKDRRFDMPRSFFRFMVSPQNVMLSRPWRTPVAALPDAEAIEVYRLGLDDFPDQFFTAYGGIWQRVLPFAVLTQRERELWQGLRMPEQRRLEWLLGRVAAKDAVRQFVKKRYHIDLCPADVEILPDGDGRPVVHGRWREQLPEAPQLTLSHTAGIAVAAVGDHVAGGGLGIDIETVDRMNEDVERLAFTPHERALLEAVSGADRDTWSLRLWCAKEAVAKAVGHGMVGGPQALEAQEFDLEHGTVWIRLRGELARMVDDPDGAAQVVPTTVEGNLVAAAAVYAAYGRPKEYAEKS